ncbi:hypothetical protein D0T53_03855 [Dysgonomonas sp. 216]|uniref:hypothetical protein n=1 Tax=Dysgonomonas sp. 216 TaxID=2302934 RepID=UPI0013D16800|nr:hypothetical protein [Dysgonomonas sp. 216]NDW18051.1 hypothetical protein [Dysgonomonas sp. 216]
MAKIYNIENSHKSETSECRPFDVKEQKEELNEYTSAYAEVLRILKEAFSFVDITQIIKRRL